MEELTIGASAYFINDRRLLNFGSFFLLLRVVVVVVAVAVVVVVVAS